MRDSSLILLFCFVSLTPLVASIALGEETRYADSTTVMAVEIPVNVFKNGEPVRGLTKDDFEILDRGESRPLLGFDVIDLEAIALPEKPAAVPAVAQRHFLLFFDLAYSRTKALVNSIRGSRDLVTSLHSTDRVAVAVFGLSGGARVLLNFTTDQGQVNGVLDVLEGLVNRDLKVDDVTPGVRGDETDPLRLVAADPAALSAEISRVAGIEFSAPGQTLRTMAIMGGGGSAMANIPDLQADVIADMDERVTKELKGRQRSEALKLANSFEALAELTRGIDGRKYLVYLSEGFEGYLMEGRGATGFLRDLNKAFDQLRRSGWAIQSVDAGGIRGLDEQFNSEGSMVLFARETGGDVYQNFNNLGTAMESLLDKTGVTYLLAFQSPEIAQDGSFHPIEVKLKNARERNLGRAQLRHRSGYYAPNPEDAATDDQRLFASGDRLMSGEPGGDLDLAALVTPLRAATGDGSDVSIWIEVNGQDLLKSFDGENLGVELFVYALSETGEVRDFLTQTFQVDGARVQQRLARGGNFKFYGDLHLAPGRYDLRVLVQAASGQSYGLRRIPVKVNDLSGSAPLLLEPLFFDDPARPSLVAREAQSAEVESSARYPFRVGSDQYFPAVRPAAAAGQATRISLMAYRIEGLLLQAATVVRRDGSPAEAGQLHMVGKDAQDGLAQIFFDFEPESLEPGEYAVQVALVHPETAETYTTTAAFQLVR